MKTLKILAVPNEDGFGPSSLTSHIVRELLRSGDPICEVTIWNKSREAYNRELFLGNPRVTVVPVDNIIALFKVDGMPSIPKTLTTIGDYRKRSNDYLVHQGDFDLVVDFGVPAAARWASKRSTLSVSVFDHSWSKTLELILLEQEGMMFRDLPEGCRFSDAERTAWLHMIDGLHNGVRRDVHRCEIQAPRRDGAPGDSSVSPAATTPARNSRWLACCVQR